LNARDEDILLMRFNGAPPADGSWELDFNGRQELLGFSGQDIRAATALDSRYENIYDDTYHFVRLILSSDRSYRYWAPLGGDSLRFTAAPGDLMFLSYDTYPGG